MKIRTTGVTDGNFNTGTYLYDASGNVKKAMNDVYVYDDVSRIVSGTVKQFGATTQEYSYDPFGNLQTITTDGVVRGTPTSSSTNRMTGATYDGAGNVTSLGLSSYSYDAFNMLVDSTIGGVSRSYVYTADDERIASATTSPVVGTWKVRDLDGQVLREFREAPLPGPNFSWTRDYVRRDGQLLAKVEPSGTQHLHLDHLGTVRKITNSSGVTVSDHHFYPFGEEATASGTEPMKFTGHERDLNGGGDLDLDYMHARYYSPWMGRFLSVDPREIRFASMKPQRWNRYAYTRNNPLKFTDPDGREEKSKSGSILDVLGSLLRSASANQNILPNTVVMDGKTQRAGLSSSDLVLIAGAVVAVSTFDDIFGASAPDGNSDTIRRQQGGAEEAKRQFDATVDPDSVEDKGDGVLVGKDRKTGRTVILRGKSTDPNSEVTLEEQRATERGRTRSRKVRFDPLDDEFDPKTER